MRKLVLYEIFTALAILALLSLLFLVPKTIEDPFERLGFVFTIGPFSCLAIIVACAYFFITAKKDKVFLSPFLIGASAGNLAFAFIGRVSFDSPQVIVGLFALILGVIIAFNYARNSKLSFKKVFGSLILQGIAISSLMALFL